MRLEPAIPRSRVRDSSTESLRLIKVVPSRDKANKMVYAPSETSDHNQPCPEVIKLILYVANPNIQF